MNNTNTLYWQEETYLTYNKQFDKHRINAMAGFIWQEPTTSIVLEPKAFSTMLMNTIIWELELHHRHQVYGTNGL
jgi:hypothetical protein